MASRDRAGAPNLALAPVRRRAGSVVARVTRETAVVLRLRRRPSVEALLVPPRVRRAVVRRLRVVPRPSTWRPPMALPTRLLVTVPLPRDVVVTVAAVVAEAVADLPEEPPAAARRRLRGSRPSGAVEKFLDR